MPSSLGVGWGVGDCISICAKYGTLCGRGEISIWSSNGPGGEDGSGGVVAFSARNQPPPTYLCICISIFVYIYIYIYAYVIYISYLDHQSLRKGST
jgi:hypothetical protein